jgi:hypothetical protein
METLGDKFVAKSGILVANNFYCEKCDYTCCKKYNWDKHVMTLKHKKVTIGNIEETKVAKSGTLSQIKSVHYFCHFCNKKYDSRNGLWKHKKICNNNTNNNNFINSQQKDELYNLEDISTKELVLFLFKQNNKLQESLIEMSKQSSTTNNTTNNNSHNKTFNLQFFLNETCKDAINISDFVNSIKPQLADLENTGRLGYVQGVSNIILNNLNNLNNHERPLHCSDHKREVIYIKDNNEWIKENEDKPILTKAIKIIANENIKNINEWKKLNPDCTDPDSKKNNLYLKIVSNSMSGTTAEESSKNINKIISNLAKEVTIDKNN